MTKAAIPYCDHAAPIWFTDQSEKAMTPAPIKRQILRNNQTVVRLCG